jgi:hypothetical protein
MSTTTSSPSAVIAIAEPAFTNAERLALAGFLAGYTGLTREAYALDLRQLASWCQQHLVRLFDARRPDIECLARDLEARGRARATVTRRLCTIAGFYRYAVEESCWIIPRSPTSAGGSLTRSSAATTSRTVSCRTRPSGPNSTNGRGRSMSYASFGGVPGAHCYRAWLKCAPRPRRMQLRAL